MSLNVEKYLTERALPLPSRGIRIGSHNIPYGTILRWDCLRHRWVWWFWPHHTLLHNTWGRGPLQIKVGKEVISRASIWGQVWMTWMGFRIYYVPPAKYPWNQRQ